jgi:hypothetical protein
MIAMGGTIDIWLTADTAGLTPSDSTRLLMDTTRRANTP